MTKHTEEQENILAYNFEEGNLGIKALAGTGKTYISTLVAEAYTQKYPDQSILSFCFSKLDQVESQKRMPTTVESRTSHSFGRSVYCKLVGENRPDVISWKMQDILYLLKLDFKANKSDWTRLLSICKMNMFISPDSSMPTNIGIKLTEEEFDNILMQTSVDLAPYDQRGAYNIVCQALEISRQWAFGRYKKFPRINKKTKQAVTKPTIDFDDMIYIPVLYAAKNQFDKYDCIILDEAQDLALLQHMLISFTVHEKTKLLIVGDPNQAIYGFRGANEESFRLLMEQYKCNMLPLSINFRCDRKIIEEAQILVPEIKCMEGKPNGTVQTIPNDKEWLGKIDSVNAAIICRFNAPLVSAFYPLLKAGKNARILGSDIGKGLATILKTKTPNSSNIQEVGMGLITWRDSKLAALEEDSLLNPNHSRTNEMKAQTINDQFDCLRLVLKYEQDKDKALRRLEIMFDDKAMPDIVLSSMHKTKGREFEEVYIIEKELPEKIKERQSKGQRKQEKNLRYVAVTRAKNKLVFVKEDMDEEFEQ